MYGGRLDFLWLELTNRCNLQCVHCYTESHPGSGDRDVLTTAQYESVMRQAYALGCRRLQFIGGEPQLHPDFLRLLGVAKETGFEFIEVFTNLTRLRDDTLRFAADAGIRFATSVYSDDPAVHNAITKVGSSHTRTIKNLERLIARGVGTRAAVIRIDQGPGAIERTRDFLRDLGVPHVRDARCAASAADRGCWTGRPSWTAAPRAASRQVARRAQPDRRAGPAMTFARPRQRRSRRRWPWSSYPR